MFAHMRQPVSSHSPYSLNGIAPPLPQGGHLSHHQSYDDDMPPQPLNSPPPTPGGGGSSGRDTAPLPHVSPGSNNATSLPPNLMSNHDTYAHPALLRSTSTDTNARGLFIYGMKAKWVLLRCWVFLLTLGF